MRRSRRAGGQGVVKKPHPGAEGAPAPNVTEVRIEIPDDVERARIEVEFAGEVIRCEVRGARGNRGRDCPFCGSPL